MERKTYKLEPFINNCFEDTLKEFVKYLKLKYNIKEVKFTDSRISPDKTQIGPPFKNLSYIYVNLIFMSSHSWSNDGGYEVCDCKLYDDSNLYVRWDTHISNNRKCEELDLVFFRKFKLQKLNQC